MTHWISGPGESISLGYQTLGRLTQWDSGEIDLSWRLRPRERETRNACTSLLFCMFGSKKIGLPPTKYMHIFKS